jgi:hypothetical protein
MMDMRNNIQQAPQTFTTDATVVGTLHDLARSGRYGIVTREAAVNALLASGWLFARADLDRLAKRGEIKVIDVTGSFTLTEELGRVEVPA